MRLRRRSSTNFPAVRKLQEIGKLSDEVKAIRLSLLVTLEVAIVETLSKLI
jgi:hypothetical protein